MKRRPRHRFAVWIACASLGLAVGESRVALGAEPAPRPSADVVERATRLKKQGDEAVLNIKFSEALRFYDESLRLMPNPALHYNRGRAFEALERTVEAIDAYETFMREAPAELRAKTTGLAEHIEELRRKTTKLAVEVDVAGARVLLRRVVLGTTPLPPVRVNAGPATLEIEAEGYVPNRSDVELPGGGELALRVKLAPKVAPAPALAAMEPVSAPSGAAAPEESKSVLERWWFWTGVGVVVAGGATVLVVALTSKSEPAPRDGTLGNVTAPLLRF